jgi:hypothetical protein
LSEQAEDFTRPSLEGLCKRSQLPLDLFAELLPEESEHMVYAAWLFFTAPEMVHGLIQQAEAESAARRR